MSAVTVADASAGRPGWAVDGAVPDANDADENQAIAEDGWVVSGI
jgi:hypothetical protein